MSIQGQVVNLWIPVFKKMYVLYLDEWHEHQISIILTLDNI